MVTETRGPSMPQKVATLVVRSTKAAVANQDRKLMATTARIGLLVIQLSLENRFGQFPKADDDP